MSAFFLSGISALWLGILTSISPCPLTTNIAAISYLGRQAEHTDRVFLNGVLYTLGRTATYVLLAVLSVFTILSIPHLSFWLQRYMSKAMGPILLAVGLVLLGIIRLPALNLIRDKDLQLPDHKRGAWGAGALGMLFALSFLPNIGRSVLWKSYSSCNRVKVCCCPTSSLWAWNCLACVRLCCPDCAGCQICSCGVPALDCTGDMGTTNHRRSVHRHRRLFMLDPSHFLM